MERNFKNITSVAGYVLIIQGTDFDGLDFGIQTAHVRFFHLQQTSRYRVVDYQR